MSYIVLNPSLFPKLCLLLQPFKVIATGQTLCSDTSTGSHNIHSNIIPLHCSLISILKALLYITLRQLRQCTLRDTQTHSLISHPLLQSHQSLPSAILTLITLKFYTDFLESCTSQLSWPLLVTYQHAGLISIEHCHNRVLECHYYILDNHYSNTMENTDPTHGP